MTGHQHHNQAQPKTTAHPGLDQHAALIAADRAKAAPYITTMRDVEQELLRSLLRVIPDLDTTQAGAVMLCAGSFVASLLPRLPNEQRPHAGPIAANLYQLAGERLYTGHIPVDTTCPYRLANDTPCGHQAMAPDQETSDAYMRGHVQLHHPGQPWPPCDTRTELEYEPGTAGLIADLADPIVLPRSPAIRDGAVVDPGFGIGEPRDEPDGTDGR